MNPRAETALQYAQAGWPVFPLAPGSKVPAIPSAHPEGDPARGVCRGECSRDGHGVLDATTDRDKIAYWFRSERSDRNIGLATGAPGPDVVDVDVKHGGKGRETWQELHRAGLVQGYHAIVTTPSGGWHAYYAGSGQPNGRLDGDVDFRGAGGYVVAAGSTTPDGAYVVAGLEPAKREDHRLAGDPRALRTGAGPAGGGLRIVRGPDDDRGARLTRLVEFVAAGVPNDRNFRVFWAAKQAELHGLLDRAAEERLVDALLRADPSCDRSAEARRSIASGRRDAQREARPADREAG